MKVVLIEFSGRPAMEYYCTMVANALQDQSSINKVTLYVNKEFDPPNILQEDISLSYFTFPQSTLFSILQGASPIFISKFIDDIKSFDFDIIHFLNEMRTPANIIWTVARRYPTALTVHEPDAYIPSWHRKLILNPIQNYNTKLSSKFSDIIFVHGRNSKQILNDKGISEEKITIHPHGSFAPFYQRHNYQVSGTQEHTVLYFGRIFPGKGIGYFLSAAEQIMNRDINATFVLAGSGDLDRYQNQIDVMENLEVRNEFIDESEVAVLFERADIVVLPYEYGSQSGIIGISAGFQTPVVATDVGNFSEMVYHEQSGLLVPPKDEDALTSAIEYLIENPSARMKMGKIAYGLYQDELSWDKAARIIASCYQQELLH